MKKILLIISSIILIILLFLVLYLKIGVIAYHKISNKSFVIPGLNNNFIPQGLDYHNNKFYITGYMKNKKASPIYIIDEKTNHYKEVYMKHNNKKYTGHAGGLALTNKYIYIAGDKNELYVYDINDVNNAKNRDYVNSIGVFKINIDSKFNTAFLTIHDNKIVIGEFYRKNNYITDKKHQIKTPSNDFNKALALVYNLDETKKYGIDSLQYAYSIREKVQGMTIDKNNIYISTSYGISFSNIYKYDKNKIKEGKIKINNNNIPLYYLDSESLIYKTKIAPMSEEIIIKDNYLYIINESASKKYMFGKIINGEYCYKIKLSKL